MTNSGYNDRDPAHVCELVALKQQIQQQQGDDIRVAGYVDSCTRALSVDPMILLCDE